MLCASCGTELLPGKKFCHACGAPAATACAFCGARVEPGWRFCPECGRAQDAPPLVAREEKPARPIPETLATRIRASQAVAGERKRATVFFCDLVDSTALAERCALPVEHLDLRASGARGPDDSEEV